VFSQREGTRQVKHAHPECVVDYPFTPSILLSVLQGCNDLIWKQVLPRAGLAKISFDLKLLKLSVVEDCV
jgi:hypothetical protein